MKSRKKRRPDPKDITHFQLRCRIKTEQGWKTVKFESGEPLLGPFTLVQALIDGPVHAAKINGEGYIAVEDMKLPVRLDKPTGEVDMCGLIGKFMSPKSIQLDPGEADDWTHFNHKNLSEYQQKRKREN